MNKAKLKSYYANGTSVYRKDLENKIIVYNEHLYTNSEDIFLISNGVSIIALNNDFGMEKVETNLGNSLSKIFNDFTYNFTFGLSYSIPISFKVLMKFWAHNLCASGGTIRNISTVLEITGSLSYHLLFALTGLTIA